MGRGPAAPGLARQPAAAEQQHLGRGPGDRRGQGPPHDRLLRRVGDRDVPRRRRLVSPRGRLAAARQSSPRAWRPWPITPTARACGSACGLPGPRAGTAGRGPARGPCSRSAIRRCGPGSRTDYPRTWGTGRFTGAHRLPGRAEGRRVVPGRHAAGREGVQAGPAGARPDADRARAAPRQDHRHTSSPLDVAYHAALGYYRVQDGLRASFQTCSSKIAAMAGTWSTTACSAARTT